MKLLRIAGLAAGVMVLIIWAGCGDTFRPVATPIGPPGPDPAPLLSAFVLYQAPGGAACPDGSPAPCEGTISDINVSGDSVTANVIVGRTPVNAVCSPAPCTSGVSAVLVANRDSDGISLISALTVGTPGATPTTISLPAAAQPVFMASANGLVYSANFGLNSVSVIAPSTSSVVTTVPVGNHPVALAPTTDGKGIFVANRDDNTVSVVSTVDNTVANTINPTAGDVGPVYVLANPAGGAMYVLYQGSATVAPSIAIIDPFSGSVTGHLSLPAGGNSNFMQFESHLRRLYVTNPGTNSVSIFDASPAPPNPPVLLATVAVGSQPTALAALADGSRVYVVDSGATSGCNPNSAGGQVTVINTSSNTVPSSGGCITVGTAPVWIAASSNGTKVFVPHQGSTAGTTIINTSNNQLSAEVAAPLMDPNCDPTKSACAQTVPVFVISE